MKKIVAIGGGEIGRPGFPIETTAIDKEIIKLSGKRSPKLLFIPTASSDAVEYIEVVKKHFGRRLGCKVDALCLVNEKLSKKEIKEKILRSDIIYVGGGNTLKMMNVWRKKGVDKILKQAYENGIVLSGMSAGAICWFAKGSSDSRRFTNPKADLIKVSGLGFINALCCPHYDSEKERKPDLRKMMKKTSGVAIAFDDCSAIEVINSKYRVISSKARANAYKVYWRGNRFYQAIIKREKYLKSLSDLLEKG